MVRLNMSRALVTLALLLLSHVISAQPESGVFLRSTKNKPFSVVPVSNVTFYHEFEGVGGPSSMSSTFGGTPEFIDKIYGPINTGGTYSYSGNILLVQGKWAMQLFTQTALGGSYTCMTDLHAPLITLASAKVASLGNSIKATVNFFLTSRGVIIAPIEGNTFADTLSLFVWVPVISSTGAITYPSALGSSSTDASHVITSVSGVGNTASGPQKISIASTGTAIYHAACNGDWCVISTNVASDGVIPFYYDSSTQKFSQYASIVMSSVDQMFYASAGGTNTRVSSLGAFGLNVKNHIMTAIDFENRMWFYDLSGLTATTSVQPLTFRGMQPKAVSKTKDSIRSYGGYGYMQNSGVPAFFTNIPMTTKSFSIGSDKDKTGGGGDLLRYIAYGTLDTIISYENGHNGDLAGIAGYAAIPYGMVLNGLNGGSVSVYDYTISGNTINVVEKMVVTDDVGTSEQSYFGRSHALSCQGLAVGGWNLFSTYFYVYVPGQDMMRVITDPTVINDQMFEQTGGVQATSSVISAGIPVLLTDSEFIYMDGRNYVITSHLANQGCPTAYNSNGNDTPVPAWGVAMLVLQALILVGGCTCGACALWMIRHMPNAAAPPGSDANSKGTYARAPLEKEAHSQPPVSLGTSQLELVPPAVVSHEV